jgi:hypothetical protein
MAISPPNWAKGATPTSRGWVQNGELLVARKLSEADIAEYLGEGIPAAKPTMLRESPVTEVEFVEEVMETEEVLLESMTKRELENLGREHGIELDRRHSKTDLIDELKGHIED